MNKKKLQLSLIFAIIYIAYAVVLFLINKNFELSFWLSFGFITVAFAFMMLSYFFVSAEHRKQQVVGMSVRVLSTMYFVLEFIMGTVFMFFDSLAFAVFFVPQFIVFVLFLLCFVGAMLGANNYKSKQNSVEEQAKEE